jgi:sulfide:quinone oxidoreductase
MHTAWHRLPTGESPPRCPEGKGAIHTLNPTLLHALNDDLDQLATTVDALLQSASAEQPINLHASRKPTVLVLGASFAGLETAQKIRRYAGNRVDITVIDQKPYLLFVPNMLTEVLGNRDPASTLHMPVERALVKDGMHFLLAEVYEIDVERNCIRVLPIERPGARAQTLAYDYLVIALGCRLAYDVIPGFSRYGYTITDTFHANRLRRFLHQDYRGGPILMGSARFHQGHALENWIPTAYAPCEGPIVEAMFTMGEWVKGSGKGKPNITYFTPDTTFAVDAGPKIAKKLVQMAGQKGYRYLSNIVDVAGVTRDGVLFADGRQVEAELALIMPDWVPHPFLKEIPVCDERGFVVTDSSMRNPRYPNVMTVGDAAAATVPKLGYLGHLQSDVVAWQIARDAGVKPPGGKVPQYQPLIDCVGVMGAVMGFFLRTDAWYGGSVEIMKAGPVPHLLKEIYKTAFFMMKGKVPNWSVGMANFMANHLSLNML